MQNRSLWSIWVLHMHTNFPSQQPYRDTEKCCHQVCCCGGVAHLFPVIAHEKAHIARVETQEQVDVRVENSGIVVGSSTLTPHHSCYSRGTCVSCVKRIKLARRTACQSVSPSVRPSVTLRWKPILAHLQTAGSNVVRCDPLPFL